MHTVLHSLTNRQFRIGNIHTARPTSTLSSLVLVQNAGHKDSFTFYEVLPSSNCQQSITTFPRKGRLHKNHVISEWSVGVWSCGIAELVERFVGLEFLGQDISVSYADCQSQACEFLCMLKFSPNICLKNAQSRLTGSPPYQH